MIFRTAQGDVLQPQNPAYIPGWTGSVTGSVSLWLRSGEGSVKWTSERVSTRELEYPLAKLSLP